MDKVLKKAVKVIAVAAVTLLSLAPAWAESVEKPAESPAEAWLKRLQSLEGSWKGTTPGGKPVSLSYKTIAGETAVMEVFSYGEGPNSQSMYTIYNLDGQNLMLTHYCISNNQPRMRAEITAQEPNVLRFAFHDATNLASPQDGHMHRAMLRIVDENHIANEWTYRKGDKDVLSEGAAYERIK